MVITILLAFLTSMAIALVSTPALIRVAYLKKLVDVPGDPRKLHTRKIPTIGGIIIFAGTLVSALLWYDFIENPDFKYVAACMVILFFIGIKDDLVGTAPTKKLIGHLVVAFILVIIAELKINNMYGLFGLTQIPDWASILLSIFTYTVVVNAFNLIDGVDGLAAGVGTISCIALGLFFYFGGQIDDAILSFALAGALVGFLFFNFQPAKIFMGDSGSLLVGLVVSVLAIKLIEFPVAKLPKNMLGISKPLFAMAAMSYPLIDTLRIFIYRAIKGVSPFSADRNHIHHKLLDLGLSHAQTVLVIYTFSVVFISLSFLSIYIQPTLHFFLLAVFAIIFSQLPSLVARILKKK
jgi:UDP-GlcNAc:undecaprenyl-phosphate GlcNAc-1-phosphate transferase